MIMLRYFPEWPLGARRSILQVKPMYPTSSIKPENVYPGSFSEQIRFLGDPSGNWTKALDLTFDSAAIFGNDRSKRYALVIEDGKVKSAHVEPDNTGVNGKISLILALLLRSNSKLISLTESAASKVLG